jgi:hypothetical protein
LVVNGHPTGLTCTIFSSETTCSVGGPVSLPANSTLSLEDQNQSPGFINVADARFGFRLSPS